MKHMNTKPTMRRAAALLLSCLLLLSLCACGSTEPEQKPAERTPVQQAADKTAAILLETLTEPTCSSVGGEWAVIGLTRWDGEVPEDWLLGYRTRMEEKLRACGGVLHEKKYSDFSRVILAVTAMGGDPSDVAGYDLLMPLADYEKTVWQGINGPIFALIALNSGGWTLPVNANAETQAEPALYVRDILAAQTEGGAWGLMPGEESVDLTGMALQALAPYQDQENVRPAVDRAVEWLAAHEAVTCESVVQKIVGLTELGIPVDDPRFANETGGLFEQLMQYFIEDKGFRHLPEDTEINMMATEQALYALVAIDRQQQGKPSLYDMEDAKGQDAYFTDPVPTGMPKPVEPQNAAQTGKEGTCTVSISCSTLLDNMDLLDEAKRELVPADGWILQPTEVTFHEGESVFDVLLNVCRENKIHMEFVDTPIYNSAYIQGISNLYEFDAGNLSGWNYTVDGWTPNYGCSRYAVTDGCEIQWRYTCDLGRDLGSEISPEA